MTSPNFAAAQQRVLERHRVHESQARGFAAARQQSPPFPTLARLPYPLSRASDAGGALWDTLKGREGTRPAFRVGQVDAELLDEELLELLKGQVGEALKYFGPHIRDDYSPEILLALRAILFKLSVWDHNASYGAALQNLRYTDARAKGSDQRLPSTVQKLLYGFFTVGGRYAWEKWESWLVDQEGGYDEPSPNVRLFSRITSILSTTHSIAAFASFLVFLVNGRYRTLLDRLLRLRLASPSSQVSREVSFEYLNRQLVWHAFTEFLLFLLPLVGIGRWRRWLSRAWRKAKSALQSGDKDAGDTAVKTGPLAFLPERTCAICYQDQNPTSTSETEILGASGAPGGIIGSSQTDIVNPYETLPCGCVYCFVCLAQKLEAEEGEGWVCLRCGEIVKQCKPWNGDVLEETPRSTGGKNVGFADAEDDEKEPAQIHQVQVDEALADSSQWSTLEKSSIQERDTESDLKEQD